TRPGTTPPATPSPRPTGATTAPDGSGAPRPGKPAAPTSDAPTPTGSPSLAGRPAGEGHSRPGRPEPAAPTDTDASADPARDRTATESTAADRLPEEDAGVPEEEAEVRPTPARASRPAAAPQLTVGNGVTSSDQPVPLLTLGVGLTLMGLGLGFLGLRLRRR
ncbi:hypothetical protein, partial [Streptomyces sp. NPDC059762]|uniref:hypothetical protein n=1 Tax=Streptomyces sp. NPDC059762 TaxID=3346938 RepID=UPI003655CE6E